MKKRILSLFLVVCILSVPVYMFPMGASAATSGNCGDNLTWTLDDAGTLTISGMGDMYDWTYDSYVPWYSARKQIKIVKIDKGVASIGKSAFYRCESLTDITIPDSIISIGEGAFYYCKSLTSITIPDSVTSIGDSAFFGCDGLISVTIPDSVSSIGIYAFGWCESLTGITIPNGVTNIGYGAFDKCTSLTSITIPDSVTSIGYVAFNSCVRLESIGVSSDNANYTSVSGVLFNKNKTTLIAYPIGNKNNEYIIPDGVTIVEGFAFYGCENLKYITIPDSVTSIGNYAFCFCESLESITIPDSVTSIGDDAFRYCTKLSDVYYSGSESDWNNILIGYRNDSLTNANIHYELGDIEIAEFTVEVGETEAVIDLRIENAPENTVVYVASYGRDGKMLEVKKPILEGKGAQATLGTENVYDYRAFVWSDNMRPLCEHRTVTVNDLWQ